MTAIARDGFNGMELFFKANWLRELLPWNVVLPHQRKPSERVASAY